MSIAKNPILDGNIKFSFEKNESLYQSLRIQFKTRKSLSNIQDQFCMGKSSFEKNESLYESLEI